MKTILALIIASVVANFAAFAGDLVAVQVPNGHGQSITLYRNAASTVALSVSSNETSVQPPAVELKTVAQQNGHGQTTVLYCAAK